MRRSSMATAGVGAAVAVLGMGVPATGAPRPAAKDYGGVEVRQAGGSTEPLIATFKQAKCRRTNGGFVAEAKSTPGSHPMTLYAEIQSEGWKGFSHAYTLLRRAQRPTDPVVFIRAPGNTEYDSTVAVPGAPGGGAIAFAPKGKAISIGGVFFLRDDTEVGVAVSGAMSCTYKTKKKK